MVRTDLFQRFTLALRCLTPALVACAAPIASAVVCIGPRQAVQPADYLAGGVAQYVGRFGIYTGTPISARHFVVANHIGNAGGGQFFYNNGTATETQYACTLAGALQDLAIYRLLDGQPSFTLWAPIYTRSDEIGMPVQVVGRGVDKGPALNQAGNFIGWFWGTDDHVVTWGTNTISNTFNFGGPPGFAGPYTAFTFDQAEGPTECTAANNDSSGPVFIIDPRDGKQKLAGTIAAVDGNYSGTPNGPTFSGALFDTRGLYLGPNLISGPNPIPIKTYVVRFSQRLDFLRTVAAVPPFPCPADLSGDRTVNTADLVQFLGVFGQRVYPGAPGDLIEDGFVGTADLAAFLGAFGVPCP